MDAVHRGNAFPHQRRNPQNAAGVTKTVCFFVGGLGCGCGRWGAGWGWGVKRVLGGLAGWDGPGKKQKQIVSTVKLAPLLCARRHELAKQCC